MIAAILIALLGGWLAAPASAVAGDVGWIEDYALATDRTVPLKQLIPGSEEYYFYTCLHYQSLGQWNEVESTLKAWIDRYHDTPRIREIQNREALLTYKQNPQRTLALIRQRLNLQFNAQREQLNQKPNLPTKLDPALISRERLAQKAFAQFPQTVQGFEPAAIDWLMQQKLTPERRRSLLEVLSRPDYPNLVQMIVDDLHFANSGGFGQFAIHRQLLLAQLDELLKLMPELRNQQNFVNEYLTRLQPSDDVNWRQDPAALEAYLDRLWAFVSTLDPAHNSLKAHVLYQRLEFDRKQGKYDLERFLAYLKLPKFTGYVSPQFMEPAERRQQAANLQQDFGPETLLPIVGDDEPLVRSYLEHFLLDAKDYKIFAPYINDQYLKTVFAETKIMAGVGDAEKLYSLLPPEVYKQLKERIDLDFAYTNKTELSADDPVALDLFVKNVDTLIVKVFEINSQNFYREHLAEVGPDINLDGLVANEEKTYTYHEPPLLRVRRHFDFPALNHRGVYVIDFIGNGKASRAVIRKGKLQFVVRSSSAGQIFTIFDEQNKPQPEATLWLAGALYTPDKDGTIAVPYSNSPGRQPIVMSLGGFSSLGHFDQEAESYRLDAAMYVDREELIARRKAQLIIRPQLLVNGTPISRKSLEEVQLVLTSTDLDGVATTKEVPDFKLFADRETVYEFEVPQRLANIRFTLKAKIQNYSQNKKIDLSAEQSFSINEIDRTDKTEDLHFALVGSSYVVDLLGKTGEHEPDRPIQFVLKMRDFTQPVYVSLATDAKGEVNLGPLPGVISVAATDTQGTSHTWPILHDDHTYPQTIQGEADAPVEVPYMGDQQKPDRSELSLLELRGEKFEADWFDNISLKDGLLSLDKLPPGDYSLLLKPSGRQIRIRLTEGERRGAYVMGPYRKLEVRNSRPLQMRNVEVGDKTIRVQLVNVSPLARVHVFATRFDPAFPAYGILSGILPAEPNWRTVPEPESQYVAGRNIGDEYRYIIDRKFARKYPGNMLERPSLLLNPWAIRSTETAEQAAQAGENFRGGGPQNRGTNGQPVMKPFVVPQQADFADLDFLAASSIVVANVVPDKDGVIEIKRSDLGAHQQLLFVAVDLQNTVSRIVALPEAKSDYLDLRLAKSLDPKLHYTQQKLISILPAGGTLVVPDITSTHFEEYDSIGRAFSLYAALNPDAKLIEFDFIKNWPTLKVEEKRKLYRKYASHELHFFLYKKDPEFFKSAILPYLANKKDKQFLDHWLLGDDLSDYLKPWNFEQLNTWERILLGQRVKDDHASTARLIKDQFELLPPNPDRFTHLFDTALKGASLDTEDRFGIMEHQKREERAVVQEEAEAKLLGRNNLALSDRATANVPAPAAAPAMPPAPAAAGKPGADSFQFERGRRRDGAEKDMKKAEAGESKEALDADFADDRSRAAGLKQYYRKLDKTMEWVESNYYHLPIEQETSALITANAFWLDYANFDPASGKPFLSTNLAEPTHDFPEMLAALSLVDLPFKPGDHKSTFKGTQMTLTAGSPMIVYHEEIQPAAKVAEHTPILVSENFFRNGDQFRMENGEQVDKFVTEEFLVGTVYGCHIVVTNPTSSKKKVDVLLQIPAGALPVAGGQFTHSVHLDLDPYHTQTLEYRFYFPLPGKFVHYPVQVASNGTGGGEVLGFAAPFTFNVVRELTKVDKQSWDYISQFGSDDDVLAFLKTENILRVNLDRIAWRVQDKAFFEKVIVILSARHVYNNALWSYGVKHDDAPAIRQFLQFANEFVSQCGEWLDSPLLTIDPVARHAYQQMDYRPLVNARVGQLGRKREILNDAFFAQYEHLMSILSYRGHLDDAERMTVIYYLLLQDRVELSLDFFSQVDPDHLATRLQYDYFAAYLDFYKSEPKLARAIAVKYADYPVDRWREAFANIVSQADEIGKPTVQVIDKEDRTQVQTAQAASTPSFDFTVEARHVKINYQNLQTVRVNYYLMDIELLFSRNPFVQGEAKQFSNILPNQSETVKLPAGATNFEFPLPAKLLNSNVLVEIVGGGQTQSQAYYSNALHVKVVENYGQLWVSHDKDSKPLAKVYVKVYARQKDGTVKFYKDGYTDLRGCFDYTSLSTNEQDFVDKFSILVLSEDHGALVREANPPKQ
ncbi:MAG TPA: hypothetical protein VHX65_14620 [Pirellulales bacterium]|nr:hypothetical protein [Pirellulales bacterium]